MIPQGHQIRTLDIPLDKGPQIYEVRRGEPLKAVKPYTAEVRREIDWELVDRGVDFVSRQKAAGKPFFLYLPISRTHFPNLPSKRFEGQSRIGQFGDSLIEGDAIVGKMLDALDELGLAGDTIVVFASDSTDVRVSIPALFTMMSTRANVFTAMATGLRRSATLLTSASTPIA